MRKVTKDRSENFPSVLLFREDLDTIHAIMSGTSGTGVAIVSGDYGYDSIDDLVENVGKRIDDLRFANPPLELTFSRKKGTSLYSVDIDAAETGFLRIKELLNSRERFINYVFNLTFWGLAFIVYLIILIIDSFGAKWISPGYQYQFLLGQLLVGILIGISYATKNGHLSTIFLSHKRERESFWSRNKDAIIRGIIIALFGALAGALATRALIKLPASLGNQPTPEESSHEVVGESIQRDFLSTKFEETRSKPA
ncbi:MAG: hypothetical protein O6929_04045 [candidate division NC10 bacterium]|nr:hypothetical protein [candidate division NC10 bacterium]